jgi:hypothetical protein
MAGISMTLDNKLAGILIIAGIIKANYLAAAGDGILQIKEINDCLNKNPRLLEPFLIYTAANINNGYEELLSLEARNFIKALRNKDENVHTYLYADYNHTLKNYLFHLEACK